MQDSHVMPKSMNPWTGFLPRRAMIMARLRNPSLEISPVLNPSEKQPALIEPSLELPPKVDVPSSAPDSLDRIAAELKDCPRCKLCRTRKTVVVGEGNPRARLVFVGEGPGEQEDLQGRPFVGNAGQLLDRMIEAIGLKRSEVYICNVVKCRPPGNRNPEPDEIRACSPFLSRQLDLIQPKVIVALGKFAAQTLLQSDVKITQLRGKFHPSYLLRNPAAKREAWEDLQKVAAELNLAIPSRKNR
jgi:uracil-DNA glycosylase